MLAEKNPDIDKAVTTMYSLNEDFNIREQMIRRDEYYAHERYVQRTLAEQAKALEEKDKIIAELKAQLAAK